MNAVNTILAFAILFAGIFFLGYLNLATIPALVVVFAILEFVFSDSFYRVVSRFVTITA